MTLARSQGSIALARTGKTQEEIAARTGSNQATVCRWLNGDRVPKLSSRAVLKKAYKIPVDAWDKPPESANDAGVVHRDMKPQKGGYMAPEHVAPATLTELSVQARAQRLAVMVEELLETTKGDERTTPLEQAKVLASCASTLGLLGKLTGQTLEINESRILRLPAWTRIQDEIIRALAALGPEGGKALRAMGEALQRLGGEQP